MTSSYHWCGSGIVVYPFIQAVVSSFDVRAGHFRWAKNTSFICFCAILNCAQFSRLEFIFEPARSERANSEVNQCVVIGERASYRESDKSIQNKEANLRSNWYIKPASVPQFRLGLRL